MRLKQLELSGFKSFAKKTTLDFPEGITCIVGPNGSGKSNIVDAIRWVLAEQSTKTLRGKKGGDLVFHGSGTRPGMPTARVEIRLLNNTKQTLEVDEVVVARSVSSAGEGTYTINGQSVRRMDIEAFLARTGIGASGFRVLSQGMSDHLITMGPKEFREFIEDAAGVREYQEKRRRSLAKLKSSEENISRVRALLAELSPRLKFLEKEASKLDKKEKMLGDLAEITKQLFGFRYNQFVREENKIHEKLKALKDRGEKAERDLATIKKDLFEHRSSGQNTLIAIDSEITELEKVHYGLEKELILSQGQLALARDRAKDRIPIKKEELTEKLSALLILGEKALKEPDGALEKFREFIAKLRLVLDELTSGKDNEHLKKEIFSLEQKCSDIAKSISVSSEDLKKKKKEQASAREERDRVEGKFKEQEGLYHQAFDSVRAVEKERSSLELEEEKLKIRRDQLMRDIESVGAATLAEIVANPPERVTDEKKLEEKLWRTVRSVEHIGALDPMLVDEYRGVQERYEFLEREQSALVRTIDSLESLVDELDQEIKGRFSQALKDMSESFQNHFRIMFGGGTASLDIVRSRPKTPEKEEDDEEEEIDQEKEDGIEIKINLPNKKVKSLNMLSGGERTLVSIALLFALVNVRKPPFLVLDEIDAALDETNSERFIRLVREIAGKTQFIIITHNRATMRGADALYGVSIKDGISRLLSIRLEESVSRPV